MLRGRRRRIDYSTLQTYLTRLEDKGYVRSKLEGRAKIYAARVSQATVIRDMVNEFVDQIFDGNTHPLLQQLIEQPVNFRCWTVDDLM